MPCPSCGEQVRVRVYVSARFYTDEHGEFEMISHIIEAHTTNPTEPCHGLKSLE